MTPDEARQLPPPESLTPPSIEKDPLPEAAKEKKILPEDEEKRIERKMGQFTDCLGLDGIDAQNDTRQSEELTRQKKTEAKLRADLKQFTKDGSRYLKSRDAYTDGKISRNEYEIAKATYVESLTAHGNDEDSLDAAQTEIETLSARLDRNRGDLPNRSLNAEVGHISVIRASEEAIAEISMDLSSSIDSHADQLNALVTATELARVREQCLDLIDAVGGSDVVTRVNDSYWRQGHAMSEITNLQVERFGHTSEAVFNAESANSRFQHETQTNANVDLVVEVSSEQIADVGGRVEAALKAKGVEDPEIIAKVMTDLGLEVTLSDESHPVWKASENSIAIAQFQEQTKFGRLITELQSGRNQLQTEPTRSLRMLNSLIDLANVSEKRVDLDSTVDTVIADAALRQKEADALRQHQLDKEIDKVKAKMESQKRLSISERVAQRVWRCMEAVGTTLRRTINEAEARRQEKQASTDEYYQELLAKQRKLTKATPQ